MSTQRNGRTEGLSNFPSSRGGAEVEFESPLPKPELSPCLRMAPGAPKEVGSGTGRCERLCLPREARGGLEGQHTLRRKLYFRIWSHRLVPFVN